MYVKIMKYYVRKKLFIKGMESECVKMQKEAEEEFGNHCMSRFGTAVY